MRKPTVVEIQKDSMKYNILLEAKCMRCSKTERTTAKPDDISTYLTGELVQKVWPEMDMWSREIIIGWRTGVYVCQKCCEDEIYER